MSFYLRGTFTACVELSTLVWQIKPSRERDLHALRVLHSPLFASYVYWYNCTKGETTYIATGSSDSLHPLPCTCSEQHKRNCCDRYLRIQVAQRAGTLCKAWRGRIRFHASFQQLKQIATAPCLENNSFSFRLEKSDGWYTCIQPLHLYFRRIANTASQNGIFPFLVH